MFEADPVKRARAEMPTQLSIFNLHLVEYANSEYVMRMRRQLWKLGDADVIHQMTPLHGAGVGNHPSSEAPFLTHLIYFHCEEQFRRTLKLPSFLSCGITHISIKKPL